MQPQAASRSPRRLRHDRRLYLALLAALALPWVAAKAADRPMYRCQSGDVVTFSQEPCGPDAQPVDVHYDAPSSTQADAEARAEAMEADAQDGLAAIERDQRITALERELEALQRQRDHAVATLAAERQHGTEARDDDTYRLRKRAEMQATVDDYAVRIEAKQAQLQQLRTEQTPTGQTP
jgi:hypothetical protein